ncbi:MAG: hypothetical protein ACPL7K_05440 [Armatimonadota bacterium]|uniref:hypothetical protein n=1 Tax=Thermogutta sp. TaxID=1962930 RepID=UPI00198FAD1B|nr:hypothetical protein [Thermogutta sp.]MBC7354352.1 hypothetical protein [Thermogutta sp.]
MDTWVVGSYVRNGQKFMLGVRPYLTEDGWFFAVFERPCWASKWKVTELVGYAIDADALQDIEITYSEFGLALTESARKALDEYRATLR